MYMVAACLWTSKVSIVKLASLWCKSTLVTHELHFPSKDSYINYLNRQINFMGLYTLCIKIVLIGKLTLYNFILCVLYNRKMGKNTCKTCVSKDTFAHSWLESKDTLACQWFDLKDTSTWIILR